MATEGWKRDVMPRVRGAGLTRHGRVGAVLVVALATAFFLPSRPVGATGPELLLAGELIDRPIAADHLVLIFNEPLDPTSIPDPSDFTIEIDPPSTPLAATGLELIYQGFVGSTFFGAGGASALRLELPTTLTQGQDALLDYNPTGQPLRSLALVNVAAIFDLPVELLTPDNDLGAAFIDDGAGPDHLLLFLGWPIDPALPPASAFTVAFTERAITQTASARSLRSPGYGMGVLDLKLDIPAEAGDTVTLSYTQTSPILQFVAGAGAPPPVGSFSNVEVHVSLGAISPRDTPASPIPVTITPPDSTTGASVVDITFASVDTAGTTSLATSSTGPPPPAGFAFGEPVIYYEISTTASFSSARICISYAQTTVDPPPEASLELLHFEGGSWVPTTNQSLDTVNNVICGDATSFSPFAIAGLLPPPSFSGFFVPVDNLPVANVVKAGSAVPVRFSLGGNYGLYIFAFGSPSSQAVACDSHDPIDLIEQTVSPGSAPLTYSADIDLYTYVWKTAKTWTGCRLLTVEFFDGTTATALFTLRH